MNARARRQPNHLYVSGRQLAHQVLDSAYRVHSRLGPGVFESIYESIEAIAPVNPSRKTNQFLVFHGVHGAKAAWMILIRIPAKVSYSTASRRPL